MKRPVTPQQRLDAFKKMVKQKPDEPFVRYSLAMSYRSLGHAEEAVEEFEELLRRTPDYVPAYLMLGQVLERLGRITEAARTYREGIAAATRKNDNHAGRELGEALEALEAQPEG
ncbi:MAG TPA: tetratricopeptide repeat protein [Anaeromyxobacteraceae bacterium]|nr:tetratricopeptide repeat protein [Anaeromyxobacteraceae bacterium]